MNLSSWAACLIGAAVILGAPARADDAPPAASSTLESDFQAIRTNFQALQREKDQAARQKLLDELYGQTRAFLDAHRAQASGERLTMPAAVWLQIAASKDDWAKVEQELAALKALPALPEQLQQFLSSFEPSIPGRPAPNWKAKDIHTGEEVTLEGLRGKLVLIDFWATWCPPCRSLMQQHLQPLHQTWAGREAEFELIGLGLPMRGETAEKEVEFSQKQGYKWRKVFDATGEAGKLYQVNGIPYLVLVDPEGKVLVAGSGWAVIEKVKKVLAERLGEAPQGEKPASGE